MTAHSGVDAASLRGDRCRFSVVGAYWLIQGSNAAQWIVYSPIVRQVESYYNVGSTEVNLLSSMYMICYVIFVFFSAVVFDVVGLKRGVLLASLLNLLAAVIRLVSLYIYPSYGLLIVTQFVAAFAQILLLPSPPYIANQWFAATQRTAANTVLFSATGAGTALGLLIPPLIVRNSEKHEFAMLFLGHVFFAAAGVLWAALGFPMQPSIPPSFAANHDAVADRQRSIRAVTFDVFRSMYRIALDQYQLILSGGCAVGLSWSIAAVLPQLLEPFGVSERWSGVIGFANMGAGTLVAPFIGHLLDRSRTFHKPILLMLMGMLLCLAVLPSVLCLHYSLDTPAVLAVTFVTWTGAGILQTAMLPAMFELMVELTFPVPESISAPALLWMASFLSLVFIYVFGAILGDHPGKGESLWCLGGSVLVTGCAVAFAAYVVPVYKRQEFERKQLVQDYSEVNL